jgi:hypothetical protein
LNSLGYQYLVLNEGQEVFIDGSQPQTILEQLSGIQKDIQEQLSSQNNSLGRTCTPYTLLDELRLSGALQDGGPIVCIEDLEEEEDQQSRGGISADQISQFKEISNAYETYIYKGVEYSSASDVPIVMENGKAEIEFKINRFVGPQPCDGEGSSLEPPINECYGETDATTYPPEVVFQGKASSILDGNAVELVAGGDKIKGLPPVYVKTLEPLNISFVAFLVDGEPVGLPPNDGISTLEIVYEVTFAGEPIPEGSIVDFDLIYNGTKACSEGGSDSEDKFTEIDNLPIEIRRSLLGGFSSTRELIESIKLVSPNTTTRIEDGKSLASAFLLPTLSPLSLDFLMKATSKYDKSGRISRDMTDETEITIVGIQDNQGSYINSVERFDPVVGEWVEIDGINTPRGGSFSHYNKGDGKLYVGGGITAFGTSTTIEVFTYYNDNKQPIPDELSSSSNAVEESSSDVEFGETYGKWVVQKGTMNIGRSYTQSVIYNGNLITNSSTSSDSSMSSSSITSENSSLSSSSSDSSSIDHSDNRIYVMGGYGIDKFGLNDGVAFIPRPLSYVEYYDINNDEWILVSDMPEAVSHGSAEIYGDFVYVFSGVNVLDGGNPPSDDGYNYKIFRYDILNDEWSTVLDLSASDDRIILQRISPNSYIVDDKIYLFGGLVGEYNIDTDTDRFNMGLVEIDISDDQNIVWDIIDYSETIVNRFRFGGEFLDGQYYTYGGSGNKEYALSNTVESYSSNTLRALEIFNSNTETWETYGSLNGLIRARHSFGSTNDGEYCYAISGAGTGYPENKLFIYITLTPEKMRADGVQSVAVNVEVRKGTGEPPEDGVKLQIRGFVVLPAELFQDGCEGTAEDSSNLQKNVTQNSTIGDIVNAEQSAIERLGNKVSLYPVKFSSTEGSLIDGAVNFVLFERGEDPLTALEDLLQFAEGDDEIIGLVFDEKTGQIILPKVNPTIVNQNEVRELYDILVEGTIDDPFYFGQTNSVCGVSESLGVDIEPDIPQNNLVQSTEKNQPCSPSANVFSDIMWFPASTVNENIMAYDEFIEDLEFIEQDAPFGGSAHWDAIIDNSTEVLKTDAIPEVNGLPVGKIIVDVADNEQNLSKFTVENALESLQSIDGYEKTPIFMNSFLVDFPPSLSARAGSSNIADFEYLSEETLGLSHTLLDPSFVIPVANRIKTDAVGSIGSGTYIQVVDLGEEVLVNDIENSFDIYAFSSGGIYIEYGSDGYNYELYERVFEPNTLVDFNIKARFIRFSVFLETTYGNPVDITPTPPPVFNSISIGYSDPNRQYIYTYPVNTNFPAREIFVTSNSTLVPECSSVEIGISHSDSSDWFDYASEAQPSVSERGRILIVDRRLSTLDLQEISEGGNTVDSPKTYEQITDEFIQDQQESFNEIIVKIIVIEENTSSSDGQTLLIFENGDQQVVDEAPDYSEASDLSSLTGQNPTFNVTEGTVFNYDFMKTDNGYDFYSTYGAWQPGALVNIYLNNVLLNTSEYITFSRLGLVRFNTIRNSSDSVALEVILPPRFRIGIQIENGDYRANVALDEFAYMFSQDILTGISRGNVPPEARNLYIDPVDANINSTFTAVYTYYDVKNDPERGSIINWYINDNLANELANKISWSGADLVGKRLKDGDRIYFTVQPSDGEIFGKTTISSKVVLGVTPPTVESIRFVYFRSLVAVSEPTSATDIVVDYEYSDALGRPETGSTIQWFLNGDPLDVGGTYVQQINAGQTGVVQSEEGAGEEVVITQRGNNIEAIVTPNNGIVSGVPVSTGNVIVQNSAPSIQNLKISPDSPTIASVLSFTYNYIDADNDDDNSIYEWYRNGEKIDSLDGSTTVSSTFLNRGDSWYVRITPFDGLAQGFPVNSSTITIR